MFDVEYRIDGRRFSPHKLGDAVRRQVLLGSVDDMKRSVGRVRCGVHSGAPKILVRMSQ